MPTYNTPGVYIEEISTLPASIAAVETAIPAFVGHTQLVDDGDIVDGLINKPTRITSLLEYEEIFGGANPESISITVDDELDATDALLTRTITAALPAPSDYLMYHSIKMFFANGGGPCHIVSVGDYGDAVDDGDSTTGIIGGFTALEKVDEPTLLVFPDAVSLTDEIEYGNVVVAALAHCNKLKDRFTIADVYDNGTNTAISDYRGALGLDSLKYGAAYHPFLKTTLNHGYDEGVLTITAHNENGAAAAVDPLSLTDTLTDWSVNNPSLYRSIIAAIAAQVYVELPPSGAIAGIYARVDSQRGVWKAPANVSLNSVIAPTVKITNEQQEGLNVDASTGKSINAIRTFTGKGTLVWGARTLAGNDNEWRYVPVRRLYIFIEESVKKATEFVVFEPNDANTWLRVKTMIENFLSKLWRDGALAGAKPEDAFFVKVGLGETMTALDILEGRMNVEIGLAAVRPAEFIILKFSHKLQES